MLKMLVSSLIWISGWILCYYLLDVLHLSLWFGLLIPGSVGLANLYLERVTKHDEDIDYIRDKKINKILN